MESVSYTDESRDNREWRDGVCCESRTEIGKERESRVGEASPDSGAGEAFECEAEAGSGGTMLVLMWLFLRGVDVVGILCVVVLFCARVQEVDRCGGGESPLLGCSQARRAFLRRYSRLPISSASWHAMPHCQQSMFCEFLGYLCQ